MYRRPSEIKQARYFSCKVHREEAKRMFPLTEKQIESLSLGRGRKDNGLKGTKKSDQAKNRISEAHIKYHKENPNAAMLRGEKIKGDNHYFWKGGITKIQVAIRTSSKNRNWIRAIKQRDGYKCSICGNDSGLEVHHIMPMKELIDKYKIKSYRETYIIEDFWDIKNGITLCQKCHILIDNKRLGKLQ